MENIENFKKEIHKIENDDIKKEKREIEEYIYMFRGIRNIILSIIFCSFVYVFSHEIEDFFLYYNFTYIGILIIISNGVLLSMSAYIVLTIIVKLFTTFMKYVNDYNEKVDRLREIEKIGIK